MIKLSRSSNVKKIVLASSLLIAPTLAFSSEMNEDQAIPTNDQLQMLQEMSEYANEGEFSTYRIESKSKQGSQALMGEWNISYDYNGSQTDKIVIDGTNTLEDGEIYSVGSYYANQTGKKQAFFCVDMDSIYACATESVAGGDMVGFMFSISVDSISNGFFATSSSIEGLFAGFESQEYPITGSRGAGSGTDPITAPETDPIVPGNNEASFDNASNEMTIPVLNYKDTKYKLILSLARADEEKVIFELKDVQEISTTSIFSASPRLAKKSPFQVSQPEPTPTPTSEASFDDVSGEMTIPVLDINGDKFSLTLVMKSSGVFGKTTFEVTEIQQL